MTQWIKPFCSVTLIYISCISCNYIFLCTYICILKPIQIWFPDQINGQKNNVSFLGGLTGKERLYAYKRKLKSFVPMNLDSRKSCENIESGRILNT